MKKVYFVVFFVMNFLGALASTGASVDVSTTLKLVNTTKMVCTKTFAANKNAEFKLTGLNSEKVDVYVKEAGNGKVELSNASGEKVLVDLKSNIAINKDSVNGNIALGTKANNLKGKMTLRVMCN